MKGDFIKVEPTAEAILTRRINELAHNVGMSRQHKKLVKDLLFHATQEWYHMGYEEGFEDHKSIMIDGDIGDDQKYRKGHADGQQEVIDYVNNFGQ